MLFGIWPFAFGIFQREETLAKTCDSSKISPLMAHKKAGGSTQNGRDSYSKRRGVKRFGGQVVRAGEVLIRQKGTWYRPGKNTYAGKDWTIHARVDGVVTFSQKQLLKFNGRKEKETFVHVKAA